MLFKEAAIPLIDCIAITFALCFMSWIWLLVAAIMVQFSKSQIDKSEGFRKFSLYYELKDPHYLELLREKLEREGVILPRKEEYHEKRGHLL